MDRTVTRATLLIAGNGICLLRALDFIQAHMTDMLPALKALALLMPGAGMFAAYTMLLAQEPKPTPNRELFSAAMIATEIAMWAGYLGMLG